MSRGVAPQTPFTEVSKQGDTVGYIKLHIKRQCTTIDEGILVVEHRPVVQHFFAPVHRFITSES